MKKIKRIFKLSLLGILGIIILNCAKYNVSEATTLSKGEILGYYDPDYSAYYEQSNTLFLGDYVLDQRRFAQMLLDDADYVSSMSADNIMSLYNAKLIQSIGSVSYWYINSKADSNRMTIYPNTFSRRK